MKKKIILLLTVLSMIGTATACGNKDYFDTVYTFNKAIINLGNGEIIEGKVDSWTDFESGDQIQVTINGTTYLVHSTNITLIND